MAVFSGCELPADPLQRVFDRVAQDPGDLFDVWVFFFWVYHLIALQRPPQEDDRLVVVPFVPDPVCVERAAPSRRFFSGECHRDPCRQLWDDLRGDG